MAVSDSHATVNVATNKQVTLNMRQEGVLNCVKTFDKLMNCSWDSGSDAKWVGNHLSKWHISWGLR